MIPGDDGSNLVPSVVALDQDNRPFVGNAARNSLIATPERAVYSIKRLMGRGVDDIQEELKFFPFRLAEDLQAGEVLRIRLGERTFTPPEISALILRQLKRNAERFFGAQVTKTSADAAAGGGAPSSDACALRSTGCSLTTLTCVDCALSSLKCLPASVDAATVSPPGGCAVARSVETGTPGDSFGKGKLGVPPFSMYTDPSRATPNATARAISFQDCERVSVACRAKPFSHHTRKSSTSTAGKASASTAVMLCGSVGRANLDSPFAPRAGGAQFPRQGCVAPVGAGNAHLTLVERDLRSGLLHSPAQITL